MTTHAPNTFKTLVYMCMELNSKFMQLFHIQTFAIYALYKHEPHQIKHKVLHKTYYISGNLCNGNCSQEIFTGVI